MNLRIFTLDEFVVSNILTIPRIYGAKDYSVDKDISGLALRGKPYRITDSDRLNEVTWALVMESQNDMHSFNSNDFLNHDNNVSKNNDLICLEEHFLFMFLITNQCVDPNPNVLPR